MVGLGKVGGVRFWPRWRASCKWRRRLLQPGRRRLCLPVHLATTSADTVSEHAGDEGRERPEGGVLHYQVGR